MDLLRIKHIDFTMSIECPKFEGIWSKAVTNVGVENLTSTYSWSDGVQSVKLSNLTDPAIEIIQGEPNRAIFFDNANYPIWVEFNSNVTQAEFSSMLQNVNEGFSFRSHILAGFLNYGNDIGKSEINLRYRIGGILCLYARKKRIIL